VRIHTYVIAVDAGSAPNYDPPFVTLTVCKPRIRRKAAIGDCVLAFAGVGVNPSDPHAVVWAGVVTEIIPLDEYWSDPRFSGKKPDRTPLPDNFYRPTRNGLQQVPNPIHGQDSVARDIGGINALVFDPAWGFGAYGPRLPAEFGLRMVGGRRGERICELAHKEWQALRSWLDAQTPGVAQKETRGRSCHPPKHSSPIRRC
jgi:hypothetical protein